MISPTTTSSNSPPLSKSVLLDDPGVLDLKKRTLHLSQKVENLKTVVSEKEREIEYWKCRVQGDAEPQETVEDLEIKLEKAVSEVTSLKRSQSVQEVEYKSNFIEKTKHHKELTELQGKVSYLTSENERLQTIIKEKLKGSNDKANLEQEIDILKEKNQDLESKLDVYRTENKKFEEILLQNSKTIEQWKTKYNSSETDKQKLEIKVIDQVKEVHELRKYKEERESRNLKSQNEIEHLKLEAERLNNLLEQKQKELREIKQERQSSQRKEVELEYFKEKAHLTAKENEKLHLALIERKNDADLWKAKYNDVNKRLGTMLDFETKVVKLTTENEDLTVKFNKRSEAYKKLKGVYTKIYLDYNNLYDKYEEITQENNEYKNLVTEYAKMISEVKNSVVKNDFTP